MPTFACLANFKRDFDALSPKQQAAFLTAAERFVESLHRGDGFRKSLRVKGVQGTSGIFELTWGEDGRATFEYGEERAGDPEIVWRRVGVHEGLA